MDALRFNNMFETVDYWCRVVQSAERLGFFEKREKSLNTN